MSRDISHTRGGRRLEPHIGGLLRMAWQEIRKRIYEGVRDAGYADLQPAHVALLRFPGITGLRPSELAEQMQITKQSVNGLLRHLEQGGYIKLHPDPEDARARLIGLTARGRRLEDTIFRIAAESERDFQAVTGERRFRELRSGLEEIVAATRGDYGSGDSA